MPVLPGPMTDSRDWIQHAIEEGADVLYLNGVWRLSNLASIASALQTLRLANHGQYVLDGSRLEALDTAAGFVLFRHLAGLGCNEAMVTARSFDPKHERLLALVRERMECPPASARSKHP